MLGWRLQGLLINISQKGCLMSSNITVSSLSVNSKDYNCNLLQSFTIKKNQLESAGFLPFESDIQSECQLHTLEGVKGQLMYKLINKTDLKPSYRVLNDQIEANQKARKASSKDIQKLLLSERITGKSIFDQKSHSGGPSYLEYNAQDRGDFELAEKINDLRWQENIVHQCGKSVIWLEGEKTKDNYLKKVKCRKAWCPDCGGKNGIIHKSRMSAVQTRVNVEDKNIQQLILTTPVHIRPQLMNRKNLEYLVQSGKQLTEHFFGVPVLDKYGHIKKYHLDDGVICNIHIFGDKKPGVYHPHINIDILVKKGQRLKLKPSILESIKKYWLKKLKKFDENLEVVDVQYKYKKTPGECMLALKYMCRPWSAEDYAAVEDEKFKSFLVLELSGFRYLRFWGAVSDKRYKDEISLPEVKSEVESVVGEPLKMLFVAPFDEVAWSGRIDLIADGLFRVRKRNTAEEERSFQECFNFFSSQALKG